MRNLQLLLVVVFLGLYSHTETRAQEVAVKTNLLYDATTTINLGVEMVTAPHWSFDLSGNYNPWKFSDGKRWRHWLLQPEARYWLCAPMGGHFFAAHLYGGQYNIGHLDMGSLHFLGTDYRKLKDYRFQGWFVGAGIGYGYAWILNRHWNIEAEIAIGWAYTRFDTYQCAGCGKKLDKGRVHNYVGPTKAAVNLTYVF